MKFACALTLVGSVAAYAPMSMTFSIGGKKKAASAPPTQGGAVQFNQPSAALPFAKNGCPDTLDGSLIGDNGFDPVGFSASNIVTIFDKNGEGNTMTNLQWLREAELIHGRIAQLAVLGFIWPALFGTLPGNEWTGVDAYAQTSPLAALDSVPGAAITQIIAFMAFLELGRVNVIRKEGASHMPGDQKLGQGPDSWNPFGLNYSPEEYEVKQLQEIKHCRLAMMGAIGLLLQNANSGESVVDQLGAALVAPEYYARAGYFLPEGI